MNNTNSSVSHDRLCRVYVGNLPYRVRWQELKEHMAQVGEVAYADVFKDQVTGKSKGCGTVQYTNPEDAIAAKKLTNTMLMDRPIFVREDREELPERRSGGGGGGGGGGYFGRGDGGYRRGYGGYDNYRGGGGGGRYSSYRGGRDRMRTGSRGGEEGGIGGKQIYVSNLSYRTSWQDLKDYFRRCGPVARVDILESDDGRSKGSATVLFDNERDARRAIEDFDGVDFMDRPLYIRLDRFA